MSSREDSQARPAIPPVPDRFESPETARLESLLGERTLVLASGSPRRRDLLGRTGLRFEILPADIPEQRSPGEPPRAFAERLALEKARAVAERSGPPALVLGSDTIVVLGPDVLGKPRDEAHACELLGRITGRQHEVVTAIAGVDRKSAHARVESHSSRVQMRSASEDEIRRYVEGGEPMDKAGAYALQGDGRRFVSSVEGSPTNVIGLPVEETLALLVRVAEESR